MGYFNELLQALLAEKEADLAAFASVTARMSLQEKRSAGLLWYPVLVRDEEPDRADYLTVTIARTSDLGEASDFRIFSKAKLFSYRGAETHALEGTINRLGNNQLQMHIREDRLPDWTKDGKLGLELLFDDYTYDEMAKALRQAAELEHKQQLPELAKLLIGLAPADKASANTYLPTKTSLNEEQQQAVKGILDANALAIVHGPPGTGKTTTLVAAIKSLLADNDHQLLKVRSLIEG